METTIDEVSIEIDSNSKSASDGLDLLSKSIERLQTRLSIGLKRIGKFNSAIISLKKVSTNVNIDNKTFESLQFSLDGFKNLPSTNNLKSTLEQLKSIPDINKNLNDTEISNFTKKVKDLTEALKPLATEMVKVSTSFSALPNNITKINTSLSKAQKIVKGSTNKGNFIENLFGGKYGKIIQIGLLINGIQRLGTTISGFVNESNSYIENMNLFSVSMGEAADKAKEFINQYTSVLGIDPSNMMRYMGMFNTLVEGFGLSSDAAYTMSKNLTQLSYDMSSFLNIPIDQAMQKIKSGISGEIEPMRAVGIALDQATLQETAYTLGIDKKVSAMTRAQKTELLYYQIMTKTTKMQGDMARTLKKKWGIIKKFIIENRAKSVKAKLILC